jgi:predicted ABC-type ATPase
MFAGPNGSGKSTLKSILPQALLGVYLNADEIEQDIRDQGFLDLGSLHVETNEAELFGFLGRSALLGEKGFTADLKHLRLDDGHLIFHGHSVNGYHVSAILDFVRQKLLTGKETFTFETVMSHPGKVHLLEQAQRAGYRTYLYYIATEDPDINIARIRNRVALGGHAVPEDKVRSRYERSLSLLLDAIRHTNRAYIWDNSGSPRQQTWLAEITGGCEMEIKSDLIPAWFKKWVLDRV